jgi:predicted metalloprotease with PDZ domain
MGHSGAAIAIDVGVKSTPSELTNDWILVHEMVHTALPDLEGPQHWLEEGLATYVEPLARRRAGIRTAEDVWAEWVDQMPNGLPQAGDRGLDATPTWGRTYWGGALFCLLADVEIRRRTNNAHSLGDALRAVLAAGGSIAESWPIERVLDIGDAATGVPVLREQYSRMAHAPVPVDLPALWKSLGVSGAGRTVTFDDAAPLASVRRGITEAP